MASSPSPGVGSTSDPAKSTSASEDVNGGGHAERDHGADALDERTPFLVRSASAVAKIHVPDDVEAVSSGAIAAARARITLLYGALLAEVSTDPFARFVGPIITATLLASLTRGGPWPWIAVFVTQTGARAFASAGVKSPPVLLAVLNATIAGVMFSMGTRFSTVKPSVALDPIPPPLEQLEAQLETDLEEGQGLATAAADGRRVLVGYVEKTVQSTWRALWDANKLSITACGLSVVLFVLSFLPFHVPTSVLGGPSPDPACPSHPVSGQDPAQPRPCLDAAALPFNLVWLDAYLVLSLVRVVLIRCDFFMP